MKSKIYKYKAPFMPLAKGGGGGISFDKWNFNIVDKIEKLLKETEKILIFFVNYPDFQTAPVSVIYNKVVPKTSRIRKIFLYGSKPKQIGSEYIVNNNIINKVRIVYECRQEDILSTIKKLKELLDLISNSDFQLNLNQIFKKSIKNKSSKKLVKKEVEELIRNNYSWFKYNYKEIVSDLVFIEKIELKYFEKFKEPQIFSFLPLKPIEELLKIFKNRDIIFNYESFIASEFWNLDIITLNKIVDLFPFLFSYAANDTEFENVNEGTEFSNIEDLLNFDSLKFNNTVIGVFDSASNLPKKWDVLIENQNLVPIHKNRDFDHGTQVTSIISANDLINEKKDNLGFFKIKLFEVLPEGRILTSYLMRTIEIVVSNNYKDIKIWNLSIGCIKDGNKISVFGKLIDSLQYKYNVQFIISAGNKGKSNLTAPADSLTSISVGSIYKNKNNNIKICKYSGSSKIFGIFDKPTTYEYGNSIGSVEWDESYLFSLNSNLNYKISNGTSFSTPLITRKFAYLMEKFNLETFTTRALINYLSHLNVNKYCDLSLLDKKGDIFLFIEGSIDSGEKSEIRVELPVSENYLHFSASYSLAYNVPNHLELGDEYCPIDISFRLAEIINNKRSNILVNDKKSEKIDGLSASEIDLRLFFGKFNPNTILLDKDFLNSSKKKIELNSNKLSFVVDRTDLIDNNIGKIQYGIVIHLKELVENSLENFELYNNENILNNYSDVELINEQNLEIEQEI